MPTIEPCIVLPGAASPAATRDAINGWIARARLLGYHGCVFDVSAAKGTADATRLVKDATTAWEGFASFTRKTVFIDSRTDIKQRLAGIRDRAGVDVLCVRSTNPEVLNFAGRDGRIDAIRLEDDGELSAFNDGVASLAGQASTFVELSFKPLLYTRGAGRSRIIRAYNKVLDLCDRYKAPVLLACDASTHVELKGPWQKIVTTTLLLNASKQVMVAVVKKNPATLVSADRAVLIASPAAGTIDDDGDVNGG